MTDDRLGEAKRAPILEIAQKLGAKLKRAGAVELVGPCPLCGGTDRFSINTKDSVFNCRGAGGGDVVKMVEHCRGLDFDGALEWITGRARERRGPRQQAHRRDEAPPDDDIPPPFDEAPTGQDAAPGGGSKAEARAESERLKWEAIRNGPTKVYRYRDETGGTIFQVCRYEWTGEDGKKKKTFMQRRSPRQSDPPESIKHGYVLSIPDEFVVPYNLPDIIEAVAAGELVACCEGEKDADTLTEWGISATCFLAGGSRIPADLSAFIGADVLLFQDNDPQSTDKDGRALFHSNGRPRIPGKDYVQKIGRALKPYVKRIRVLEFPEIRLKGDVTDWRDEYGGTVEKLFDKINAEARPWAPEKPVSKFGAISWVDMDKTGDPVEWLVEDMLTTGDKSVIGGASGSGKTFYAMGLAAAVARGVDFMGHKTLQGLVLYQAGESGRGVLGRARALRKHAGIHKDAELPMEFMTKRVDLFTPNADVQNFIDEAKSWADYYMDSPLRLIVIDTLAKASIGAEENSSKEMGIVLDNADKIVAATGAAVLLVHHMNQDGKKLRGSTAIYANVEQVIGISLDDEVSKVRTAKMVKMKDGEDKREIKFELMSVEIGWDKRLNKAQTSCVVLSLGEKGALKSAESRKGFQLRRDEELVFKALMNALKFHGEIAPIEIVSADGARAVRIAKWKQEFVKITGIPRDDGDERAFDAKVNTALKRGSESLQKFGIIKRENPFAWLSGKPVRGYPETFPAPSAETFRQYADSDNEPPLSEEDAARLL